MDDGQVYVVGLLVESFDGCGGASTTSKDTFDDSESQTPCSSNPMRRHNRSITRSIDQRHWWERVLRAYLIRMSASDLGGSCAGEQRRKTAAVGHGPSANAPIGEPNRLYRNRSTQFLLASFSTDHRPAYPPLPAYTYSWSPDQSTRVELKPPLSLESPHMHGPSQCTKLWYKDARHPIEIQFYDTTRSPVDGKLIGIPLIERQMWLINTHTYTCIRPFVRPPCC